MTLILMIFILFGVICVAAGVFTGIYEKWQMMKIRIKKARESK